MAIADTITSMQNHTSNAYNILQYGTDLTNVHKNLENLKQCIFDSLINSMSNTLNTTWNNLPKITTTPSTSQSINNTIEAPMRITLSPSELRQDTTTGINLLNNNVATTTRNDVVFTNLGNNEFNLNGTLTSGTDGYLGTGLNIPLEEGQTYTLYFECFGGTMTNPAVEINIALNGTRNGASVFNMHYQSIRNVNSPLILKNTFTATGTEVITACNLYSGSGTTFNNYKIRVMIYKGTADLSWEKYTGGIPAPNPNYPQDIHTISGNNTIKVEGKNLFDKNGTFTKPVDYWVLPVNLKSNTQYTLSSTLIGTALTNVVFAIAPSGDKYSDFSSTMRSTISYGTGTPQNVTFTTDSTWTSPKFVVYATNQTILDSIFDNYNIQLEVGSTATTYEPYISQEADIDLGTNLIGLDTTQYKVDLKEGDKITARNETESSIVLNFYTNYGDSSRNDFFYISPNESRTISTTHDTKAIAWLSNVPRTGNGIAWANYGSSILPYSTYKEPIEYCKIGNYEDKFIRSNDGTWQLKKNIGKVVLDGSESGQAYSDKDTASYYCYWITAPDDIIVTQNVTGILKCNYFAESTWSDIYAKTNDTPVIALRDNKRLYFRSSETTYSNFQTWLSTHNTIVDYPLATPTYTQITGTLAEQLENVYKNMLSQEGTTNISQVNNDLSFELSVSAIEDLV